MHRMQVTEEKQQERNRQKPKAREQVRQEIQKENLLITEQMVKDQEEIMETVPMPVTEDRRETETVREDPRVTARDARAEDHRAMEIVRVDVSAAREDLRAITVREADHRVIVRVVRMETEVRDATDASAVVRDVRDSARIPERMMIWYLHRN